MCSGPSLWGDEWTQNRPVKSSLKHHRAPVSVEVSSDHISVLFAPLNSQDLDVTSVTVPTADSPSSMLSSWYNHSNNRVYCRVDRCHSGWLDVLIVKMYRALHIGHGFPLANSGFSLHFVTCVPFWSSTTGGRCRDLHGRPMNVGAHNNTTSEQQRYCVNAVWTFQHGLHTTVLKGPLSAELPHQHSWCLRHINMHRWVKDTGALLCADACMCEWINTCMLKSTNLF